jgi:hypothetical protein
MINENADAFTRSSLDFGYNDDFHMVIQVKPETTPLYSRPIRLNPKLAEIAQNEIDKLVKLGIILPVHSPWNSPCFLVKKNCKSSHAHLNQGRTYKWRLITDFRNVNARLIMGKLPVNTLQDSIDTIAQGVAEINKSFM